MYFQIDRDVAFRRSQNTLTVWTQRSLMSHPACQKKPEHTHFLDTFQKEPYEPFRRSQNTLTDWTHFQKVPYKPSSLPEGARTHSLSGHIFRRCLMSHSAWPRIHLLPGHIFRWSLMSHPACQRQNTLTIWTHFQKKSH